MRIWAVDRIRCYCCDYFRSMESIHKNSFQSGEDQKLLWFSCSLFINFSKTITQFSEPMLFAMKNPVQVFSRPVGDPPPSGVAEPAPARLSRPGSASSSPTEVPTPTPPQTLIEIAGGPECPGVTASEYPDVGKLASWRGAVIMLITGGSQFLDNVFMTSANIALPSIQKEFDVNSGNLQWMISAYTLTFGGFLLLAGVLSDRYVPHLSMSLARAISE